MERIDGSYEIKKEDYKVVFVIKKDGVVYGLKSNTSEYTHSDMLNKIYDKEDYSTNELKIMTYGAYHGDITAIYDYGYVLLLMFPKYLYEKQIDSFNKIIDNMFLEEDHLIESAVMKYSSLDNDECIFDELEEDDLNDIRGRDNSIKDKDELKLYVKKLIYEK